MPSDMTPPVPAGRQVIQSYGGGGFRISGVRYGGSVIVFPEKTRAWSVASFEEISATALAPVADAKDEVDILLIGCGPTLRQISLPLRAELRAAGIAVEVMDTGAACRTYNVLMVEGRRVAAALIAVE